MNVRPAKGTQGLSIRERNGYLLLCSILFIPLATEFLYQQSTPQSTSSVISVNKVETVDSFIRTPESEKIKSYTKKNTTQVVEPIEINQADSVTLLKINGVGPVLAGRIVKYRNLLGGYVHIEQLQEVYGLKEEHYSKIKTQVLVRKNVVKQIRMDSIIQFPYQVYHPYWDKESKKELVVARKNGMSMDSLSVLVYANKNKHWKDYLIE